MKKKFVSDLEIKNEYYAHLIRSGDVYAKLIDIEIPELPEDFYFFSAKDIAGKNKIKILKTDIPIFAENTIEYFGQAVGILIGPDKQKGKDLKNSFKIKTLALNTPKTPFSFDEEELDYFDYPVMDKVELNSEQNSLNASSENIDEIFEKANRIVYSTCSIGQKYHYYSETACVKTSFENDRLNIHLATQWPFSVLESVASVLNISKDKINIVLYSEGESLDGKMWFPSLLATQIAVAAYLSKKNISIEFSRQEDFLYTTKSPAFLIQHKTALSKTGKIIAMDVSIIIDAGNINPFINQILKHSIVAAAGIYYLPNYRMTATAIKTKLGLTGLFVGWGDSIVTMALEKHINEIIYQYDLCPIQFRMRNVLEPEQNYIFDIKKDKPFIFENLFKAVCNTSDFYRKYHSYKLLNGSRKNRYDGKWRSIGIAVGLQYNGSNILIKSGINYRVEMTLTKENKVIVKAEPTPSRLKKILQKQIAKTLELKDEDVSFLGGETDVMISTGPNTSSAGLEIIPELVSKCCVGIKNRRFRNALPITVVRSHTINKKNDWDNEALKGMPFHSFTPGACAVEIELDTSTYQVKIKKIWLSCIAGKVYSKKMAIRALHKSITMAISNTILEKIGEKGIGQYKIMSTANIPPMQAIILDSELKSKGLGEIALGLVPAAYVSALNQIVDKDKKISAIPVLTNNIFRAFVSGVEIKNEEDK